MDNQYLTQEDVNDLLQVLRNHNLKLDEIIKEIIFIVVFKLILLQRHHHQIHSYL